MIEKDGIWGGEAPAEPALGVGLGGSLALPITAMGHQTGGAL